MYEGPLKKTKGMMMNKMPRDTVYYVLYIFTFLLILFLVWGCATRPSFTVRYKECVKVRVKPAIDIYVCTPHNPAKSKAKLRIDN